MARVSVVADLGDDDWPWMKPGTPPYQACGLATVETFYGEPVSVDLITRVRETPGRPARRACPSGGIRVPPVA
jgi:hypothetical protein